MAEAHAALLTLADLETVGELEAAAELEPAGGASEQPPSPGGEGTLRMALTLPSAADESSDRVNARSPYSSRAANTRRRASVIRSGSPSPRR